MAYPEPRGASYARQLELQFVRLLFFGYRSGSWIGGRFYRLCRRFGPDRTMRLSSLPRVRPAQRDTRTCHARRRREESTRSRRKAL